MLTYYNPHVDDFLAEPLQFRLLKRRALKKYSFLLDESRRSNTSVRALVDGTASGLIPETLFQRLPRWLRLVLANLEFRLWKRTNGFGDEIQRVDIPNVPVNEVLIAFSYKSATGRFLLREATLGHYRAVVFHLSHYFLATAEKAAHIRRLPNAHLAGDSDITGIPYFQHFFGWYKKPFLVLPFAVAIRFTNRKPWLERDVRAVATGSFHDLRLERPACKYTDFMSATGEMTYHPVRLTIYQSASRMAAWVHCKVSPYRQYGKNQFSRLITHFYVSQKKYFSINIVDLYNQHRYAVVGEELSGFPALGAFEAMACGCVLIAQPQYYVGLGLELGVHYLPYDGSTDQLLELLQTSVTTDHTEMATQAAKEIYALFSASAAFKRWENALTQAL